MKRGKYNSYIEYIGDRFVRKMKRLSREKKIALCYGSIALLIGLFIGGKIGGTIERNNAEKEMIAVTAQLKKENEEQIEIVQKQLEEALDESKEVTTTVSKELPWNMVLVNFENPMEEGYKVAELVELTPGYSVDSRIAEAAKKMLQDAKDAGMKIIICSAYRSVERQEELFNQSLRDRLNSGLNYWDAFVDTRMSVAEPGTSEHALGMALDLISNQYTGLDERQQETKEAKWLAENCHKYGFILRYPPEKTDITGIIYEPWHYRYVGVEDATKIMELGITLEEYLETYY